MKRRLLLWPSLFLLLLAGPAPGQPELRRFLVTVAERTGEPLTAAEFEVRLNGKPVEVTRVYQPQERPVRLALLIDDSAGAVVAGSLPALATLLRSLPQGSEAMIGYLRRGKLITAQAFTPNLEGAAASLRAPSGVPDAGPADLGELISETLALFPDHPPARAQVLYLGQGTDAHPHDLLLERAIRQAQQHGAPVWVVHIPPGPGGGIPEAGRRELPPAPSPAPGSPVSYAEAYLARLSEETGGDTFGLGQQPVGLERYLDRFHSLLDRQYLVEINAPEARPGSRLRVEIPRRDLRLLHPRN